MMPDHLESIPEEQSQLSPRSSVIQNTTMASKMNQDQTGQQETIVHLEQQVLELRQSNLTKDVLISKFI